MHRLRFSKRDITCIARGLDKSKWTERKFTSEEHEQPVIDVTLSGEALQEISRKAKEVYAKARGQLSSEENYRVGMIGQCADTFYLEGDCRKGLETVTFGMPDLFDIMHNGCKIEVKTFRWTHAYDPECWMLIPLRQFNSATRRYPFYIANQRMHDDVIRILGYIDRECLKLVGNKELNPLFPDTIRVEHLKDFVPIKCLKCADVKNVHCEKYGSFCSKLFDGLGLTWDQP